MNYEANPLRGCGTKKEDSFYLEGGPSSPNGKLARLTWVLGDGHSDMMTFAVPPLASVWCNLAATLYTRSVYLGMYYPNGDISVWNWWANATRTFGLVDHVGKSHYDPAGFAYEVAEYGPSRKVPPRMAVELAKAIAHHGPIPVVFTHSDMPIFKNEADKMQAYESACKILDPHKREDALPRDQHRAVWANDQWSMYADGYHGWDSSLIDIIEAHHAEPDSVPYITMEQPFCASWMCQVTYTIPETGESKWGKELNEIHTLPSFNPIKL